MSGAAASEARLSARRIGAMVLRHVYILRGSWPRLLELAYWPTVQMIIWGFITQFLRTNSSWVANAFGVLLAAVLLWDVLFRGQLGFSLSFLEEMWSRNLGHLFVTPLRPIEHVLSMMAMSLIRTLIGVVPAALLAIRLYDFSVFTLGLPLVGFFASLMFASWSVGLFVTALMLRYGLGAESLAWFFIFLLAPVSAVYYPVSVLPGLAATGLLGAALDLRVRGHARGAGPAQLPSRADDRRLRPRRGLHRARPLRLSLLLPQRPPPRPAPPGRGVEDPGASRLLTREGGEGDHAKHGGGGSCRPTAQAERAPTTALRAVPLPRLRG